MSYFTVVQLDCVFTGDSLANNNGQRFSAKDRDQDAYNARHYGQAHGGGWWFKACFHGYLNGRYVEGGTTSRAQGIIWSHWKGYYYSLKHTEMKIRPN